MRKFLLWTFVSMIVSGAIEPAMYPGFGLPIPWVKDICFVIGGVTGIFLVCRYGQNL